MSWCHTAELQYSAHYFYIACIVDAGPMIISSLGALKNLNMANGHGSICEGWCRWVVQTIRMVIWFKELKKCVIREWAPCVSHMVNVFFQVSRCGMIYMEPQSLGWRPLMKSWLRTLPSTFGEAQKRTLVSMFERFVDPCLGLVRKRLKVGYLLLQPWVVWRGPWRAQYDPCKRRSAVLRLLWDTCHVRSLYNCYYLLLFLLCV